MTYFVILQVMARLQGQDGLSVEVAVSLLVADSRLARAVLASHEGQEMLVTLAGVEGDREAQ